MENLAVFKPFTPSECQLAHNIITWWIFDGFPWVFATKTVVVFTLTVPVIREEPGTQCLEHIYGTQATYAHALQNPQKCEEKTIGPAVSWTFLFSPTWELVLLTKRGMHNLHIISFLPLTMCNRKIVDTIPPCKIIRSTKARMWALRIKTWMLERKARAQVDLQTHKGSKI